MTIKKRGDIAADLLFESVHMEQDRAAASKPAPAVRKVYGRRQRWAKSGWRTPAKADSFRAVGPYLATVYRKAIVHSADCDREIWAFRATDLITERSIYSQRPYASEAEAKLRSFDAIEWLTAQASASFLRRMPR